MPVQITIIGLGQIGASIGLALKERGTDVHIVGNDKNSHTAKTAKKIGAVDAFKYNLPDSVRDAGIVILALPLGEVRETLEVIAPDLQEGALVLDASLSKGTFVSWAEELIPQGRFYMGLFPAIHPEYLNDTKTGVEAARADLFEKGVMVITAPATAPANIFDLTANLITILGSMPLVMDAVEADGLIGKIQVLPQLAAAALLNTTLDQPGWVEAKKISGRPYAAVTAGLADHDDAPSLREYALGNRENTVRLLNEYITSLIELRDEIETSDSDALAKRLNDAWEGRDDWLNDRFAAKWLDRSSDKMDVPAFGRQLSHMFFGSSDRDRLLTKRK
ncbi:MAG TPA: prephenate dehydrogenase [Anaerolineales bacterium]|nr:prephenate dehydrogenase [Anaerolineales bacterium]